MVVIIEEMRAKADLCFGDEEGKERSKFLLKEVGLPTDLLPLRDILECGYMEDTGFVWLKQKNKIEHKFEKIGRQVIYGTRSTPMLISIRSKSTGCQDKGDVNLAFDNPEVKIQLEYKLPPKIIDNVEVAEEVKEAMVAEEVKEAMVAEEVKDPIVAKEVKELNPWQ
ncbi:hypothetical protein IFM89_017719 [Coptis chinensis]|uniref:Uncharacterized protein n=1 Tax=Coptis chinensis TaxID=261450 RepID=A0A835HIA9_9MAGN|nr:hypothetical protein IFM89_017719 [Coptis chinensis]